MQSRSTFGLLIFVLLCSCDDTIDVGSLTPFYFILFDFDFFFKFSGFPLFTVPVSSSPLKLTILILLPGSQFTAGYKEEKSQEHP